LARSHASPDIFEDVEEVTQIGPDTYQKRVTGPGGKTIVWEARITEDVPGSKIAWESTGEGHVETVGNVQFQDKRDRCAITVSMKYDPPGGKVGEMVAKAHLAQSRGAGPASARVVQARRGGMVEGGMTASRLTRLPALAVSAKLWSASTEP
jgi:hypothetical protein